MQRKGQGMQSEEERKGKRVKNKKRLKKRKNMRNGLEQRTEQGMVQNRGQKEE